jgi:gliding-associated putative ABC transporter substrate-binding component GldG
MKQKSGIQKMSGRLYYSLLIIIVLAVLVLLNVIVSHFDFRKDFTKDQRYSLTESTISYLSTDTVFQNPILFKIYLDGELPAEIKRLQSSIKDKLDEFRYYAGEKIQYEFIDPNEGSLEDQNALKEQLFNKGRGIRPMRIQYRTKGKSELLEVFPGAVVEYPGSSTEYIRFMEGGNYNLDFRLEDQIQKAVNAIEYNLMRVSSKVTRRNKKNLAFIHGHGELGIPYTQGARRSIQDAYNIEDIVIDGSIHALDNVDGIIIADPSQRFSDKDKFVIDQYLMKGGNIMLFYNPLMIFNDTLRRQGKVHSMRKRTGIENLVFDYGIKINEDLIVDADYDPLVFPGVSKGFVRWYFYVRAKGTNHPISSMVDPVKLPYASTLHFVENKANLKPSVLLTSSSNAVSFGSVPILSIAIEQNYGENPRFQEDPENPENRIMLGGLLEGDFISAYKNRIVDTYANDPNAIFNEESVSPGKLMVVSNGTFFKNWYYDSTFVREDGKYQYIPRVPRGNEIDELLATDRRIGNFDFFENCVDYMLGESTLLAIRSRTIDLNPMNKLKIEESSSYYQFINLFIPIILVLVLALVIYFMRKYKYAKK